MRVWVRPGESSVLPVSFVGPLVRPPAAVLHNMIDPTQIRESVEVPKSPYGYCPVCGAAGVRRERRPDGNDTCANGHVYPAKESLTSPPVKKPATPSLGTITTHDAAPTM